MAISEKVRSSIKDSEFQPELEELIYLTQRLKTYSRQVFLTAIMSMVVLALYAYFHALFGQHLSELSRYKTNSYIESEIILWISTFFFPIINIFTLYQFSITKRKGIVIYDELTEELDWSYKRKEYIKRPPIETRIVIKDFLQNTDLPFTSGQNGQAFYLGFSFLEIITIILIRLI